ncbi:hypothetical protein ACFZBU_02385 [Embleya sp. NPDC008237]|uniref:hypothetical protein n=1 Tax=Embleya sp. NPDC008237 TaxID=3363978 RepID=UPI0036F13202
MFRTPAAAAPITDRITDTFSVLDTRPATQTGLRITADAADAAAAIRRAASPPEPPRPRHRREARIATPRPARTDHRAATSSGYRPR